MIYFPGQRVRWTQKHSKRKGKSNNNKAAVSGNVKWDDVGEREEEKKKTKQQQH